MKSLVIEKEDLKHNIQAIKKHAKINGKDDKGNYTKIIAVVKANAYGLGIVEFTKVLIENGFDFFAVSTIEEALELRNAGIKEKVLMLSSTSIKEEIEILIKNKITITIGSKQSAIIANEIGEKLKKVIKVHLKIDTGFGRYGFLYTEPEKIVESIKGLKNIEIEGTFSHFSLAFYKKDKYTKIQFDRFIKVIETLKMNEINTGMLHICNSSSFIKFPQMHLNAVRIGSAFTGRIPFVEKLGLRKLGRFETNVVEIKELPKGFNVGYSNSFKTKENTKIAIIPVGYEDGINIVVGKDMFRIRDKLRYIFGDSKNLLKKQSIYVKINDKNCKIIGRVGTYHMIADISGKDINIGDKVIINISPKFVNSKIRRVYK